MKHNITHRKLNRTSSHRKALLMNLSNALIKHEQITTTLAKAKELKSFVDKLITLGKKGDLQSRRKAISILKVKPKKSKKMFSRRAVQYQELLGHNQYDLIKLAKFLNEITYDLLNDSLGYSMSLWFKNVFVQFYLLYSIHYKIQPQQALLEVLEILQISKDNKYLEGMSFPVQK